MWGKDGKGGYGLAHILERREAQALEYPNITKEQAKDYALNIIHLIPEILDNGVRADVNNRITIKHNGFIVGLHDEWMKQKLQNKWVVTSYEVYDENKELRTFLKSKKEKVEDSRELTAISSPVRDYKEPLNLLNSATENNPTLKETISQEKPLSVLEKSQLDYKKDEKVLRELETRSPLSNDYKGNSNYSALNLNGNNPTKENLTSQEKPLKSAKENITNHEKALIKLYEIDEKTLTEEQKEVLKVFKGELDSAIIKGRDLEDLYWLESGVKKYGARKIIRRHYGTEKLGGVNNDELLNMGEVIKNGSVLLESFEKRPDRIRYAYEWDNNGVKLRVVVDELENKNKIFDFYSDRNTTGAGPIQDPPAKNNITKEALTSQGAKR